MKRKGQYLKICGRWHRSLPQGLTIWCITTRPQESFLCPNPILQKRSGGQRSVLKRLSFSFCFLAIRNKSDVWLTDRPTDRPTDRATSSCAGRQCVTINSNIYTISLNKKLPHPICKSLVHKRITSKQIELVPDAHVLKVLLAVIDSWPGGGLLAQTQ